MSIEPQYVDADAAGLNLQICIADGRPLLLLPMGMVLPIGQVNGELFRWTYRDMPDPDDANAPPPPTRYARLLVEELFPEPSAEPRNIAVRRKLGNGWCNVLTTRSDWAANEGARDRPEPATPRPGFRPCADCTTEITCEESGEDRCP